MPDTYNTTVPARPTVTIFADDYAELLEDQKVLSALIAGGVDNWSGYDFCMEEMEE